jgi:hypothetical protein
LRIDELAAEAFAELLDELEYAKQKTLKSVPSVERMAAVGRRQVLAEEADGDLARALTAPGEGAAGHTRSWRAAPLANSKVRTEHIHSACG